MFHRPNSFVSVLMNVLRHVIFIVTFSNFIYLGIYGVSVRAQSVQNYCTRVKLNLLKSTAYLHHQFNIQQL
jgi:hypothetical protein